jgi:rhodanese-related sulfurtransferase
MIHNGQLAEGTQITLTSLQRSYERDAMPLTITKGYKALLHDANAAVKTLTTATVAELRLRDDVVLVDLRDPRELEREGRIEGAFHCPRGMLEFWIDPESPYAKPIFQEEKQFIFFCAGGWRSALAAKSAQDMGLKPVAHMEGGFGAWKKGEFPIVEGTPSK